MAAKRPNWWLDLLFPPACAVCDAPLWGCADALLCPECHRRMPWRRASACFKCGASEFHGPPSVRCRIDPAAADGPERPGRVMRSCASCLNRNWRFARAAGVAEYEGSARALVLALKFRGAAEYAPAMGILMARRIRDAGFPGFDAIAPIPLCWTRLRARGYNQAELLARAAAKESGIPLRRDWLVRRRTTPTQMGQSAEARRAFPLDAFTARAAAKGARILLVDDVLTTGATASAAAGALLDVGAVDVHVVVFAR